MGDLDLAIGAALAAFGVAPRYDGIAVAVFDHGNAPPDVSDGCFVSTTWPSASRRAAPRWAFAASRRRRSSLRAVADARARMPTLRTDTAPAAILGALDDRALPSRKI